MNSLKILNQVLQRSLGSLLEAVRSLHFVNNFKMHRRLFLELGGKITEDYPILTDYSDQAGIMSGHYFHQDLYVAQMINAHNPSRHLDVGSRIDGFVAHVASFRALEIIDIRPMESNVMNISFLQADMSSPPSHIGKTDSLSCLHVLEHFGLGRYGDKIDPNGHLHGFRALISLLEDGARFYLSFPISSQERVAFNAHRVFHPLSPLSWPGAEFLALQEFSFVDDSGNLHKNSLPEEAANANLRFGCGIYTFARKSNNFK